MERRAEARKDDGARDNRSSFGDGAAMPGDAAGVMAGEECTSDEVPASERGDICTLFEAVTRGDVSRGELLPERGERRGENSPDFRLDCDIASDAFCNFNER